MEISIKTSFNALHFDTAMYSRPASECFTCHTELFEGQPSLSRDYHHADYGHQHNDSSNALAHAAGVLSTLTSMLEQKKPNTNLTNSDFQEQLHQLTQDYRNFMRCFQLGTATEWNNHSPKAIARDFTETMLHFSQFKFVYLALQPFYSGGFLTPERPISAEDFPDFYDLILRVSDFLILQQHADFGLTRMFYQILSSGTETPFEGFTSVDRVVFSHWKEHRNVYFDILSGYPVVPSSSAASSRFAGIREQFNQLLPDSNRDTLQQSTFDTLDHFFEAPVDSLDMNERREYFLMANVLLQRYIVLLLYLLWASPASIQKKERSAVLGKRQYLLPYQYLYFYAKKLRDSETDYLRLLDYTAAAQISRFLLHSLSADDSTETVCYYTSLDNFAFMLPDHCTDDLADRCAKLTIMHLSYMNDPNEGKMLQKALYKTADVRSGNERLDLSTPYVFLKSFSPHLDYLPMWEMYGGKAQGCCVVLNWKESLSDSKRAAVPLYRVCYLNHANNTYRINALDNPGLTNLPQFRKWFSQLRRIARKSGIDRTIFNQLLGSLLYLFKDSSYSYERELRIVYSYNQAPENLLHTNQKPPKLFVQPDFHVQIDELILGPKFENIADHLPYLQEQLDKMVEPYLLRSAPRISLSNIDYR